MDNVSWQPGEQGKGVVDKDGSVHIFNDEDYELHQHYLAEHAHIEPISYFYVAPNGAVEITMPSATYDGSGAHDLMMEHIIETDPVLHAAPQDNWQF